MCCVWRSIIYADTKHNGMESNKIKKKNWTNIVTWMKCSQNAPQIIVEREIWYRRGEKQRKSEMCEGLEISRNIRLCRTAQSVLWIIYKRQKQEELWIQSGHPHPYFCCLFYVEIQRSQHVCLFVYFCVYVR